MVVAGARADELIPVVRTVGARDHDTIRAIARAVERRSLSLWKRALVVTFALYVLGFQPHVELSAQCGDREIEHRHVALVLAAVNVRIFEVDLVTGEAWGTGYGERESVLMQPPCPEFEKP